MSTSETPITAITIPEYGLPFDSINWEISAAKLNNKTWLVCDADFIADYGQHLRGMPVRIIGSKTNGIFRPDRSYFWSADNSHWIEDTGISHLHNLDTDEAGGLYRNILLANISNYYEMNMLHPNSNRFVVLVSGGAVNTTANGVELVTDNIANDWAQIKLPGGAIDLRKPCAVDINGYSMSGKNFAAKIGIGMENVTATEGLTQRFGIEVCDVANTQRTWNLASGDGTAWTMEPTSEACERTTSQGWKLELLPLQNVKYSRLDSSNFDIISIKTSNVPGTGQTAVGNVFAAGYKTNETVIKTYFLSALRIIGKLPNYFLAPSQIAGST
jgi:hypothetical protein